MVSHLFFADDNLVFFRATLHDSLQVKNCLQVYEKASSQVVNYEKSVIAFCPSSTSRIIEEIKQVFNIPIVRGHDLYLGLPTFSIRNKKIQFASLRDRVFKRINGWSSKLFSACGKETLLKYVIQAIPTYAMSFFKIPTSLCKEIEQLCAKFWWNSSNDRNKIHWAKWRSLCKPKQLGGLGFRSMIEFNKALIANQVWLIIHCPDSLMARILKARYFIYVDILDATMGSQPSYICQSIIWRRDLISKGIRWQVGDGRNINAFKDAWITGLSTGRSSVQFSDLNNRKVADFIDANGYWNEVALLNDFPRFEVEEILNIPLYSRCGRDHRYWK